MKNQEKVLTKPEKLAQLIYVASIRYTKVKKSPISKKNFNLDFFSVRSGNENRKNWIDVSEEDV